MENLITLAIPSLLAVLLIRLLLIPMKWICKVGIHAACGVVCLLLLNTVSGFTGLWLPINAVTVLTAGVFGVPGIALVAILEIL